MAKHRTPIFLDKCENNLCSNNKRKNIHTYCKVCQLIYDVSYKKGYNRAKNTYKNK